MDQAQYALLYNTHAQFQTFYYDRNAPDPLLLRTDFKVHAPLIVSDCPKQCESIKSGATNVRSEFDYQANMSAHTAGYCLIIHDEIVEYNALRSNVTTRV